jgi:hypothetical protein
MDENSDDTVTAGKSSELLPGWEIFVDWLFVTNAMPQSIEPFSISLASSSLSDTYETASRVFAKSNFRKDGCDLPEDCHRFSLSPRERAGVRGKSAFSYPEITFGNRYRFRR